MSVLESYAARARHMARPLHWRLAEALPVVARRHYLFMAGTGRFGDFSSPRTFNEKIQWRILNDRRSRIVMACDKLAMKDYAAGAGLGDRLRIPQTLWEGTNVDDIPDIDSLPPWVLKPNNGCGDVVFGPAAIDELRARSVGWLRSKPGSQLGEWGYSRARATLMLEERVPAIEQAPTDYKFFVFDGEPVVIQVNSGRFTGQQRLTFYDPTWRKVPVTDTRVPRGDEPRPAMLPCMLELASALAEGWDFLRVDFYATANQVWFGEFSPYPGGGVARFSPRSFDEELGRRWRLPHRDLVSMKVEDEPR